MTNKTTSTEKNMQNNNDDSNAWDNLLESEQGMDAFKSLMDQAKKEDAQGTSKEI